MSMKWIIKILFLVLLNSCSMTPPAVEKINGLSFVASRDSIVEAHVEPVVDINANYAAIMPFGFIRDLNNPEVHYSWDRQWFGETPEGVTQYVKALNRSGIKIMLKPQLWISHGQYTGQIEMNNEEDWHVFEETYSSYILGFARLAESLGIEIFCIGTELDLFVQNRGIFWDKLIAEIRAVYSGKLTYASNWDEYQRVPFWKDLDLIGIDAYFPLSENKTPTVEDCRLGWRKFKPEIEKMVDLYKKPILFTEFGYRSLDYAAREPWRSDRSLLGVNHQAQTNATQALFEEFWDEPWFAGGFIWKWFHDSKWINPDENTRFTPQKKPVEALIRETFGSY